MYPSPEISIGQSIFKRGEDICFLLQGSICALFFLQYLHENGINLSELYFQIFLLSTRSLQGCSPSLPAVSWTVISPGSSSALSFSCKRIDTLIRTTIPLPSSEQPYAYQSIILGNIHHGLEPPILNRKWNCGLLSRASAMPLHLKQGAAAGEASLHLSCGCPTHSSACLYLSSSSLADADLCPLLVEVNFCQVFRALLTALLAIACYQSKTSFWGGNMTSRHFYSLWEIEGVLISSYGSMVFIFKKLQCRIGFPIFLFLICFLWWMGSFDVTCSSSWHLIVF